MAEKNDERNREILASFEAGISFVVLAERYALAPSTISSIVAMEKHKRIFKIQRTNGLRQTG